MIVRSFDRLALPERAVLYERIASWSSTAPFDCLEAMTEAFTSIEYAQGRDVFTLWRASADPVGVLGTITSELAARQEVFLVPLVLEESVAAAGLERLLGAVRERLKVESGLPPEGVIRLGVREPQRHLCGVVEQAAGFRRCYAALEMGRPAGTPRPTSEGGKGAASDLTFRPVTPARVGHYVEVHNAAIRLSPAGTMTDAQEVGDILSRAAAPDWLQVGYVGSEPAAIVGVTVEEGLGEIAVIAVEPRFQGRGYGEAALIQGMRTLRQHGATEMQLVVFDANRPAVSLYEKHGFTHRRTLSRWYATTLSALPRSGAPGPLTKRAPGAPGRRGAGCRPARRRG